MLFTAGILQLREGQLRTTPWGTICQLKQLLTDVAGGSGLHSVLPATVLMPGRWPHRNVSTLLHSAYSPQGEKGPSMLKHST